jgi:predicted transcriptional regulator
MPELKGRSFQCSVSEDLHQKLVDLAKKEERSMAWIIRKAVEMYIDTHAKKKR